MPEPRYKPRALLEPDEALLARMHALGHLEPDQVELAASLGCSVDTLQRFWREHPEFREAFEDGKAKGRLSLRRLLRSHAMLDPGTARFLAKNYLKLHDDPAKAQADTAAAGVMRSMTREEADGRILELKAKLVGGPSNDADRHDQPGMAHGEGPIPRVPARLAPPGPAQGSGAPRAPAVALHGRPGEKGAVNAVRTGRLGALHDGRAPQGRAQPQARQPHGPVGQVQAQSRVDIDALIGRVQNLEASTVRKNARKDGQPHTDRTKEVAQPANRAQEGINGGPPLLARPQRGRKP